MRFAIRLVMVGVSAIALVISSLRAQIAPTPNPITPTWIKKTFLGSFDPQRASANVNLWVSIRSKPETARALISLHEDSSESRIIRDQALTMLGSTGQAAAYTYLARVFDRSKATDYERVLAIHGLGNGPDSEDRPEFVYQRLTSALSHGTEEQRIAASMAFGRINSQRSLQLLRGQRMREASPVVRNMIDQTLSKARSP